MSNLRSMVVCMISLIAVGVHAEENTSLDPPTILPRSAWQANSEDHRSKSLQPMQTVKHVSVHHTAVNKLRGDGTPEAELQIIQMAGPQSFPANLRQPRFREASLEFRHLRSLVDQHARFLIQRSLTFSIFDQSAWLSASK